MTSHNNKKTYRANHGTTRANHLSKSFSSDKGKQEAEGSVVVYLKRFIMQALVCSCLLMSVLIIERMPHSTTYTGMRSIIASEIPFSTFNEMYKSILTNLFPFSYRVPAKDSLGITTPVSGIGTAGVGEEENQDLEAALATQLMNHMYLNIAIDQYAEGVIIRTSQGEDINSFVSGIILDKGIDEENKIGNFVTIQRPDTSIVTVGFLQNFTVSRYEHINIGDSLGRGSNLPDLDEDGYAYFYIAIQNKNGDYLNVINYLREVLQ